MPANKTIVVRIQANTGQYTAQLAAAGQQTVAFGTQVGTAATAAQSKLASFSKFAATFGKVVTLGVAGGLALSAKAAIDFESSFTGVEKTLKASEAQFARLKTEIRDLSKEIPINVNQLNSIAEIGGQLGISVSGITDFTETVAKLGVTTVLSTDEAALGLARLGNILGVSESQFENVGSSLVELGNNFASTEDQILTFALRIAPVGQTVGLTVDQVLALGTAFASVGVPAERGGTAVQRTFIAMAESVADGTEKLDTFARVAGKSTQEFADIFERDAARALDLFLQGLDDINESGGNVFAILDNVGLGSQRTVGSLLALSSAGGLLTATLDQANRATRDNVSLQTESDLRFSTTASKVELAKNQMRDFAIAVGSEVIPVVGGLAGTLDDFVDAIQSMDPALRNIIFGLLLTTTGLTAFNKAGKIAAKLFGFTLPAAIQGSTVAAKGLQVALGVGVVGALVLAVNLISNYGRRAEESRARVKTLVDVLEEQRLAIEGVSDAQVSQALQEPLLEHIERFSALDISIKRFSDAILAGGSARDDFKADLIGIRDSAEAALSVFLAERGGLFNVPAEDEAQLERLNKAFEDAKFVLDLYARSVNEVNDAYRDQGTIIKQERLAESAEILARGLAATDEKLRAINLPEFTGDLGDMGAETDAATKAIEEFNDALDDINDSIDAGFGLLDAFTNLADVMVELEKETEPSFHQLLNYSKAINDVARAAAEAGPEGIAPLISMLEAQRQAGFFTQEQFNSLMATLLTIQPVAEAFGGSSNLLIGNLGVVREALSATGVTGQNFISIMLGVEAALRGVVLNAATTLSALSLITNNTNLDLLKLNVSDEEFQDLTGGLPESVIRDLQNQFHGLEGQFINVGAAVRTAISDGIGGAGGGSSIADTLEDEVQEAIDRIKGKIDTVIAAVAAQLGSEQALRDLQEEEKNLVKLRREQKRLPDEILEAEERLARARRRARRVNLDEKLAIELAEETLARAKKAFEQGLISQTELDIAERDLNRAKNDATKENTDAVRDAQKRLRELRRREKVIAEEIRDAEIAVLEAKLQILEAQNDLIQAAKDFNDLGRKGRQIFRDMAKEAGFTAEEIKAILDTARETQDILDNTGLSGSGSGPGSGTTSPGTATGGDREYIVQSGDSLSRIASVLGITLTRLIELNSTVTNSATGQSRSLDPSLIYPGDILKYHQGGIVPGSQFSERLALLRGGEWVINPQNGGNIGGVTIENLYIRGVWDFTNPGNVKRLVGRLEQEIESNRRSRGLRSIAG
jgi:TP901 family phage tail tape measure protein